MANPKFDFTKCNVKIAQMEDLLRCNLCKSVPSGDMMFKVKACRHQLCSDCYNPGVWQGCCPVCKARCDRKNVISDYANMDFLKGLQEMKVLLAAHHLPSATRPTTFGEDGDVDLDNAAAFGGFSQVKNMEASSSGDSHRDLKRGGSETIASQSLIANVKKGKKTKNSKKSATITLDEFLSKSNEENNAGKANALDKPVDDSMPLRAKRTRGQQKPPIVTSKEPSKINETIDSQETVLNLENAGSANALDKPVDNSMPLRYSRAKRTRGQQKPPIVTSKQPSKINETIDSQESVLNLENADKANALDGPVDDSVPLGYSRAKRTRGQQKPAIGTSKQPGKINETIDSQDSVLNLENAVKPNALDKPVDDSVPLKNPKAKKTRGKEEPPIGTNRELSKINETIDSQETVLSLDATLSDAKIRRFIFKKSESNQSNLSEKSTVLLSDSDRNDTADTSKNASDTGLETALSNDDDLIFPTLGEPSKNTGRGKKSKSDHLQDTLEEEARPKPPPKKSTSKLSKKNFKGETPLHAACSKQNYAKVKELLDQGAEPNTQDNNLWTPLHEVAPYAECLNIVKLLLDHGANPNVPGGDFNTTPLHEAALSGCIENCRLLIQRGASKTARNSRGKFPFDFALNKETEKVIDETLCEMSDTEQLDATLVLNTSTVPERFLIFRHKNLRPEQTKILKVANKSMNLSMAVNFIEDVSHVIVNLDKDRKSCEPDMTYFMAVLTGKWIVDFDWLKTSVELGDFVAEDPYMASGCHDCCTNGPMQSKNNASNRLPRLLDGCHIYLQGQFGYPYPSRAELSELLKMGGATLLRREPDPESIPPDELRVPYHAPPNSPLSKCSHFIIYQEGPKEPLLKYDMKHFKSLPAAWLFECIKNFSLVDPFK